MDVLTKQEVQAYMGSRKSLYDLLAKVFHQVPDSAYLDELADTPFPVLNDGSLLDAGYRTLRFALRHRDVDTPAEIDGEFCHLLLGAGVAELTDMASPYESVYTSEDKALMGDARDSVVRAYHAEKLKLTTTENEPEDHVSYELAFVGVLCERAADALGAQDDGRALQLIQELQRFFAEHLSVWVPAFSRDLARLATTDYFRAFSRILYGVVHDESGYLSLAACALDPAAQPVDVPFLGEEAFADLNNDGGEEDTRPELSAEEEKRRADDLFKKMAFLKKPFIRILQFCETPRTTDEVQAEAQAALQYITSAYGPTDVRRMLYHAYCLDRSRPAQNDREGQAADAAAGAAGEQEASESGAALTSSAGAAGLLADGARTIAAQAEQAAPAPDTIKEAVVHTSDDEARSGSDAAAAIQKDEQAEDAQAEAEVVMLSANEEGAPEPPYIWKTSELGKSYITEDNVPDLIRSLLTRDAAWIQGYEKTLQVIKNGTGTFKEVEAAIKPLDLYQVDNKHAAMFLKRLEDAGAIEWRNKWVITPEGEKTLESLLAQAKTVAQ